MDNYTGVIHKFPSKMVNLRRHIRNYFVLRLSTSVTAVSHEAKKDANWRVTPVGDDLRAPWQR